MTASPRSEEHTSELQSRFDLVCRLLLSTLFPYTTLFRSSDFRLHQLRYFHRYGKPQPTAAARACQKQTDRSSHRGTGSARERRFSRSFTVEGLSGQSA